ncbi:hypothetical protein HJG60_008055 [Phyllostomus discolor]|uniref:Uncharacterized protein n=1 Tax=Phyllostomus discolor TaxID=89673 RepID=A0A834ERW8_9CHIR|nr:hypothetical protein HJG60_008055 [Phyllostomus discolor]
MSAESRPFLQARSDSSFGFVSSPTSCQVHSLPCFWRLPSSLHSHCRCPDSDTRHTSLLAQLVAVAPHLRGPAAPLLSWPVHPAPARQISLGGHCSDPYCPLNRLPGCEPGLAQSLSFDPTLLP